MKLILIAPGLKPVPPVGWGAIESLVWDYYENLKKQNIDVTIINSARLDEIITICNYLIPDIIHIMYDDHIILVPYLKCKKILYTSHYAYLSSPLFIESNFAYYFQNIFNKVIEYKEKIEINSISPIISEVYRKHGFNGKINDICNGAREDLFRYTLEPNKSNKSVYVAKIEKRKSQYKYQSIADIDFVGNFHDSTFDTTKPNYLGEWNKGTLYENLTEYGNLILLSNGEADPLVVKEGLLAGLGVVVSECSSANLDLSKEYITVIPNDKLEDIEYITKKIIENRQHSINHRNEIREYAMENFAWSSIIRKYIRECIM
jgi:glycosyltransferase involved in cell wall biosynthesis